MKIQQRWLPPTCYSDQPITPLGIVQHYFSGKYAFAEDPFNPDKCWQLFRDLNYAPEARDYDLYHEARMGASAHFMVTREGDILQLVPTHLIAWHAGRSHYQGRANCNDFMFGIENIGMAGVAYPAAQIEANAWLCAYLIHTYNLDKTHITGHEDIAPGRKHDPGPLFPWQTLRTSIDVYLQRGLHLG